MLIDAHYVLSNSATDAMPGLIFLPINEEFLYYILIVQTWPATFAYIAGVTRRV